MGNDTLGVTEMTTHRPCRTLPPDSEFAEPPAAMRTYHEVAEILGISWQAVWQGEQRAFRQLAAHPVMRRLLEECREIDT